jgi:hypothetical protein
MFLCKEVGNMARVVATVYGSESSTSVSRNGTRQPMTLKIDSPRANHMKINENITQK